MYICRECGSLVHETTTHRYYDRVDGNWAMSGYVEESNCCSCGGDFVEAENCKICDAWINPEHGKICEECLKEEMTIDNAIEYSRKYGYGYSVDLPDFFEIYTANEIEEILKAYIISTEDKGEKNVKEYCENDISCFSNFLENKHD